MTGNRSAIAGAALARRASLACLTTVALAAAACHRPVPVGDPQALAADSASDGASTDSSESGARGVGDARRQSRDRAEAREWQGQSAGRVEELFAGRFPGVRVYQTAQGLAVRVRGETSMTGSNAPLYIVDGFPFEAGPGGLITLNPADIASIEVLKDASSLSFYGVRGANGVVLITTKRGP